MENIVSFPGLGINDFSLNNVAFNIGGNFPIYWYGVIITCGIIFAFIYTVFRGKYEKISFDDITDVAIWTVVLGVIGARLYYVIMTIETYIPKPFNFIEFIKNVFNVRGGGLAIYGGIICGILGIVIVTRHKKINTLKLMDMAGPGVMMAQAMGRWGNFFNGEAFGGIVSEGHPLYFMRMGLISSNTVFDFHTYEMVYVHPTFLYESLWNIIGFILINIFYKKKKFNGQVACMYLAWYGFGRFFIEGLRTDSLYVGPFRISQVVGILCFVVFGGLLIAGLVYSKKTESKLFLSKFDRLLAPDLIQNPIFFEKKSEKAEKKATILTEDEETDTEEEENGTDN
mgnify:CR=1 FL=1